MPSRAKKNLDCSYKKTRLVPGNAPSQEIQRAFITQILVQVTEAEQTGGAVLFVNPMHQVHNNDNGYAWQFWGKQGTKQVLSNTGRGRLNIIGHS